MKGILVLNACTNDYPDQCRLLAGFLEQRTNGIEADTAVVFHREEADREELLCAVPVPKAVLIGLPQARTETMLNQLAELGGSGETAVYLFAGNCFGSELAVRMGQRCGGTFMAAVDGVQCAGEEITVTKSVYGGHMEAEFALKKGPYCLSVSRSSAEPAKETGRSAVAVEERTVREGPENGFSEDYAFIPGKEEKNLETAPFILAAGWGAKSREGVDAMAQAAEKIGAEFGVSRPVAMSAWAPMSSLIGVSGVMTKPEICIAAGVSGAPAFYAGIEKSGFIVSVNSDPRAPIHRKSNVAIVDDWHKVLQHLSEISEKPLKATRKNQE